VPALYRVFLALPNARPRDPGGALHVPAQGGGRLDNPDLFRVLYLGDSPSGAIAETFGRFPEWTPAILEGSPSLPGSIRSLARYQCADNEPICDLDDPARLLALNLRPSEVVSREYARTRAWARQIFQLGAWVGVKWWSYYDPRWASIGLWNAGRLTVEEIVPLQLDHPALLEAARTILRRVVLSRPLPRRHGR
jgi:RES domain